jgi:nicotinate phosphoribosyltransferase
MENKTMMTDLYELTMAQVYFNSGEREKVAIFDAFFRKEPVNAGYGIMAGLDNIIEYIQNLKFTNENIAYLRSLNLFSEDFLNYLSDFKFTGDIYAVPDGTPVFRNEPIVTVVSQPSLWLCLQHSKIGVWKSLPSSQVLIILTLCFIVRSLM